ncbi:MAG: prepilin-type N-terminal cleavage/methylation domain-containing protein [Gammaproteobacteria bacterium]
MFPSNISRSSPCARLHKCGFSIIEIFVVIAIISLLLSIAMPAYEKYQDRRDTNQAKQDILGIQAAIDKFYVENDHFPDSLAEINTQNLQDPWGSHYYYLNVADNDEKSSDTKVRRDIKLKPVNSDYDLYSAGKDRLSKPPFTASVSRDDIVRCNNGRYLGFAGEY